MKSIIICYRYIKLYLTGRKCVCTSKGCKEAGLDTCKTKFSCYTELILTAEQGISESTVTRGCTECVYTYYIALYAFNQSRISYRVSEFIS